MFGCCYRCDDHQAFLANSGRFSREAFFELSCGLPAAVPPNVQVSIDDLMARLMLRPDPATGEESLEMELQPFAKAFRDGHWLLLDELNLAPDNVLQVG